MSPKYYLISFAWCHHGGEWNRSSEVWAGSIGEWMLKAVDQPEHWQLIHHAEISEAEYMALKEKL